PASGLAKDWPSPPRSRTRTGLAVRPSAGLADGTPRILRAWARVSANGDTAGQPSWLTLRHCGRFVGASLPLGWRSSAAWLVLLSRLVSRLGGWFRPRLPASFLGSAGFAAAGRAESSPASRLGQGGIPTGCLAWP